MTFGSDAIKKVQIVKDLVTVVNKKAIATQDVICLRNEHKKYKELKS